MSDRRRMYMLGLGVILIFMTTIPPAIFDAAPKIDNAQDLGTRWGNFLYNYQSLIGGLLAVGAAFLTVRQMDITEQQSGKRHAQLVKLSLRPDLLRVERLLVPHPGELLEAEQALRSAKEEYPLESDGPNRFHLVPGHSEEVYVDGLRVVQQRIFGIWNAAPWGAAESLFGGTLAENYRQFVRGVTELGLVLDVAIGHIRRLKEPDNKIPYPTPNDQGWLETTYHKEAHKNLAILLTGALPSQVDAALDALSQMNRELGSLGGFYGISI